VSAEAFIHDVDLHAHRIAELASMAAAGRQKLTGFFGGLSLHAPFLGSGGWHETSRRIRWDRIVG
jgi:hypothetical protein